MNKQIESLNDDDAHLAKHAIEYHGLTLKQFRMMCKGASEMYEGQGMASPDYALAREAYFAGFTKACKEALEQPAQEPVACPYPCGWNNLLEITTRKGAYLVTHFDADNPMPYSYWQEISSMVDTARTMVKWAMQLYTHPAPSWQGLSDDEIHNYADHNFAFASEHFDEIFKFSRAIEQALKEKNRG